MNCPYCGKEMESGFIQSPHEISWKKGSKRPVFGAAVFHKDAVVLSGLSLWRGSAVQAFLCRDCGKVIIDCRDPRSDMNRED